MIIDVFFSKKMTVPAATMNHPVFLQHHGLTYLPQPVTPAIHCTLSTANVAGVVHRPVAQDPHHQGYDGHDLPAELQTNSRVPLTSTEFSQSQ